MNLIMWDIGEEEGLIKERGVDKRLMSIVREKLRVVREERNMFRSRREKDLMR